MPKIDAIRELYEQCKDMDIEESMELMLDAENEEEQDFISVISDFILQKKQKKVIEQKRFQMKRYILYAGVNGAEKSTLYQTTKCKDSMPRINTDEIVRQIGEWTKNLSKLNL